MFAETGGSSKKVPVTLHRTEKQIALKHSKPSYVNTIQQKSTALGYYVVSEFSQKSPQPLLDKREERSLKKTSGGGRESRGVLSGLYDELAIIRARKGP